MILMALDHVRDFFHVQAGSFSPTDLAKTNVALFLTRWVTHFCLPVFMFTAGTGAFLWWQRGDRTKRQLSRFLWTRGIWFIALELSVMQLAYNFNFSSSFPVFLLVLWIFGACMILMAMLIHLPLRALLILSLAVVAFHNCLDGVNATNFGSVGWLWNLLHQPGVFVMAGRPVLATYTVLPWVAVIALGFCFGQVLTLPAALRQRIILRIGLAMTAAFLVIRAINRYGDPSSWSVQKSALFTVLSFLNCTKYPASLDFLLLTLGPALLVLVCLDRLSLRDDNPLVVFGRVPLFYFFVHFYVIHTAAVLMAFLRYGWHAISFVFNPPPSMGGPRLLFPADFGYNLPFVYGAWIVIVLSLFPVCRWFASFKTSRPAWWKSYL